MRHLRAYTRVTDPWYPIETLGASTIGKGRACPIRLHETYLGEGEYRPGGYSHVDMSSRVPYEPPPKFNGLLSQHSLLSFSSCAYLFALCNEGTWKLTMAATGSRHFGGVSSPEVAHKLDHTGVGKTRPEKSSTPNVHVFRQNFDPFKKLIEPPPAAKASPCPIFGGSEPAFSERKARHVPIVITQNIVNTVLKSLPDSPASLGSDRRTSNSSTSDTGTGKSVVAPNSKRHIPIIIPSFAQPKDISPPTPASTQPNTPRGSPPKPYSCKSFYPIMTRPNTSHSHNGTLDSSTSMPSPSQGNIERPRPSASSTYLSDGNSSQSSLTQLTQDMQNVEPSRSFRAGEPTSYAGISSPAVGQQSQAVNGSTNLAGLVCNVHKCTGKEPHALVGTTTTVLGDKLYVFGGRVLSRRRPQLTSDLHELDLIKRHWTKIEATGDIPPPRYFHSVCPLGGTKLICYGGMSPASTASSQPQASSQDPQPEVVVMSDIYIYDTPTRVWTYIATTDTPQGRYAHCAAVLPSTAIFTSANAPLSAIHHNPASANPNQGTIGVALDGTGGAEMIVVGGQDSANHYIEQVSVFNLRSLKWTSTSALGRSCGAYRSVVAPLTTLPASKIGRGDSQSEHADDANASNDDDVNDSSMLIYSNYNFLDVKLELQVRTSDGSLAEKPMHGHFTPPGLRFPNGGVLDNHFVVSGTYLTSSKQEYALWALDLRTLTWSRIDGGGGVFSQGSWNRGVLWPRRSTFVILGNRKRSLVEDYNHRRINFSNVCMVELEAFGLYENPRRVNATSSIASVSAPIVPPPLALKFSSFGPYYSAAVDLGQKAMDLRELADMDLLAIGGERIPVNSYLLSCRWGPYFVQLLWESALSSPTSLYPTDTTSSNSEASTLRPSLHASASIASRNSSITITPSIQTTNSSGQPTLNAPSTTSKSTNSSNSKRDPFEPPNPFTFPSSSRPRQLYLPHTLLTLRALVHYLYTSSLPQPTHALCTPQILCSLLQLARPYRVDGLLEAVVERLHQVLDGRNAAAVFNAAAMAAGGGRGTGSVFGREGEPLPLDDGDQADDAGNIGLTARRVPPQQKAEPHHSPSPSTSDDDARSEVSGSTVESSVASSTDYMSASNASMDGEEEVWQGGVSCVVGLQTRGLRGLMEGRRLRERGKLGMGVNGSGNGAVGLGIA